MIETRGIGQPAAGPRGLGPRIVLFHSGAGNFGPARGVKNVALDVDDDRLIDEALTGQADSFGQLVLRYQDRLFHAMTHISGSSDDALDVVQDAFVQAFLKLEDFRRTSAFYTWLYRIAFNVAAGRRRRAKPVESLDGHAAGRIGNLPARTSRPEAQIEQQETAAGVQAALRSLPEEYRTVLVMREMDGCDYETISDVLDLPIGTVRSRLHRARERMRELLTPAREIENELPAHRDRKLDS